ncbi:MAG: YfhO family protein [Clostridiales bacterium]|nr:YfhO family protein [Clostridiales bacterium]
MRYKSSDIKDIILRFTLLFALCSVVIWLPFIIQGKTFVWNVDGISQHIPALIFFRKWLLEILGSIFSGNPDIPMWSYSLGEGSDVIDTLHYYCIGDPLCLIVLLFPEKFMGTCYTLLSVIRMYLAGIAFISFAREIRPKASAVAFICGGLVYSLSNWALYCAVRHSFFLNPLILLPLMLLGIEKIGKGKKPYLFIVMTALSAVASVYFFYMIVIMSIIYAVIRYPKIKKLLVMLASGIAGCFIGAVILLPQALFLMNDGRSGDKGGAVLFYDIMHYLKIPGGFAAGSSSEYLLMGFGAFGVIAVISLLIRPKNRKLKLFLGLTMFFMIFPVLGSIMNGFSYATNRWSFALTLLVSLMVFVVWDPFIDEIKDKFMKTMVIFSIYSIVVLVISIATADASLVTVQIVMGYLLLMLAKKTAGSVVFGDGKLAALIVMINLVINGLIPNTVLGGDRTKDFLSNDLINLAMETSDSAAIAKLDKADSSYPLRYTGPYLIENTSAVFDVYSTQYYWSQTNGAVTSARRALAIPEYRDYYYTGYDSRAGLSYLAGVKYYVVPADKKDVLKAPAGYKDPVTQDGYVIYTTDNAAPFASFFTEPLSEERWNELSITQRQDVLMTNIILDHEDLGNNIRSDAVKLKKDTVDLNSDGQTVLPLDVDCPCDGELYVVMKGFEYEGDQSRADISVSGKGVSYYTKDFNWYNGKSDFAVCLGTVGSGLRKPKITFTTPGTYRISEVTVELIPETAILDKAQTLIERSSCITDVKVRGDRVTFNISSDKDGYVLLQIPYSAGWKATCDRTDCEVLKADVMYSGLKVSSGSHKIELRYRTPGFIAGALISLISVLVLIAVAIVVKKLSSKKTKKVGTDSDAKIMIAVASHKPYDMPEGDIYQPVLAGASVSEVFLPEGWRADNTGDNISKLNPYYCELTAYYWAVRNAAPDVSYIGLVHYRRLFGKKKTGPVTEEELKSCLPDAKIFVPRPRNYFIDDLGSHYAHTLDGSHLEAVRSALRKVSPDYVSFWDKILKDKDGYMFNMNIMERSYATEYLDWLMKVLEEVCKKIAPSGLSEFERRFPGRLSELLFNCWLEREVAIGKIGPDSIVELDYYSPEKVDWPKKIKAFLEARFLGKKYHKSF